MYGAWSGLSTLAAAPTLQHVLFRIGVNER
jgi:hypothetical protein